MLISPNGDGSAYIGDGICWWSHRGRWKAKVKVRSPTLLIASGRKSPLHRYIPNSRYLFRWMKISWFSPDRQRTITTYLPTLISSTSNAARSGAPVDFTWRRRGGTQVFICCESKRYQFRSGDDSMNKAYRHRLLLHYEAWQGRLEVRIAITTCYLVESGGLYCSALVCVTLSMSSWYERVRHYRSSKVKTYISKWPSVLLKPKVGRVVYLLNL